MTDKWSKEQRETVADLEHEQWAQWAQAMIVDPTVSLSADRERRWIRLSTTKYADLSEAEKDQDRIWADKVLAAISPPGEPSSGSPEQDMRENRYAPECGGAVCGECCYAPLEPGPEGWFCAKHKVKTRAHTDASQCGTFCRVTDFPRPSPTKPTCGECENWDDDDCQCSDDEFRIQAESTRGACPDFRAPATLCHVCASEQACADAGFKPVPMGDPCADYKRREAAEGEGVIYAMHREDGTTVILSDDEAPATRADLARVWAHLVWSSKGGTSHYRLDAIESRLKALGEKE